MMDRIRERLATLAVSVIASLRRGRGRSGEEIAIAAMVVAPFTLTLVVWLGWIVWAPALVLLATWLVVQAAATLWNAGWRAPA